MAASVEPVFRVDINFTHTHLCAFLCLTHFHILPTAGTNDLFSRGLLSVQRRILAVPVLFRNYRSWYDRTKAFGVVAEFCHCRSLVVSILGGSFDSVTVRLDMENL